MAKKMQTKKAKEAYSRRKETVEPAIGRIKENLGFRSFLTRGLNAVKNEFNLACAAHNLKKIWILLQKKKKENESLRKRCDAYSLSSYFTHSTCIDLQLSDSL